MNHVFKSVDLSPRPKLTSPKRNETESPRLETLGSKTKKFFTELKLFSMVRKLRNSVSDPGTEETSKPENVSEDSRQANVSSAARKTKKRFSKRRNEIHFFKDRGSELSWKNKLFGPVHVYPDNLEVTDGAVYSQKDEGRAPERDVHALNTTFDVITANPPRRERDAESLTSGSFVSAEPCSSGVDSTKERPGEKLSAESRLKEVDSTSDASFFSLDTRSSEDISKDQRNIVTVEDEGGANDSEFFRGDTEDLDMDVSLPLLEKNIVFEDHDDKIENDLEISMEEIEQRGDGKVMDMEISPLYSEKYASDKLEIKQGQRDDLEISVDELNEQGDCSEFDMDLTCTSIPEDIVDDIHRLEITDVTNRKSNLENNEAESETHVFVDFADTSDTEDVNEDQAIVDELKSQPNEEELLQSDGKELNSNDSVPNDQPNQQYDDDVIDGSGVPFLIGENFGGSIKRVSSMISSFPLEELEMSSITAEKANNTNGNTQQRDVASDTEGANEDQISSDEERSQPKDETPFQDEAKGADFQECLPNGSFDPCDDNDSIDPSGLSLPKDKNLPDLGKNVSSINKSFLLEELDISNITAEEANTSSSKSLECSMENNLKVHNIRRSTSSPEQNRLPNDSGYQNTSGLNSILNYNISDIGSNDEVYDSANDEKEKLLDSEDDKPDASQLYSYIIVNEDKSADAGNVGSTSGNDGEMKEQSIPRRRRCTSSLLSQRNRLIFDNRLARSVSWNLPLGGWLKPVSKISRSNHRAQICETNKSIEILSRSFSQSDDDNLEY